MTIKLSLVQNGLPLQFHRLNHWLLTENFHLHLYMFMVNDEMNL
jgi:hypothetical protein